MMPLLVLTIAIVGIMPAAACTSILVTRGASADGSVMITAAGDSAGGFATLDILPAADHKPGEMISIEATHEDEVKSRAAKIPQVPHTYQVLGGLINEHQLALSETTFGGRKELLNPQGLFRYSMLMSLALQRARTAREAIDVMTKLVAEYGYADEGESISIADTKEAWILEIVGAGPGGKGAVWAACRVPDGHVSCHANQSRIGEIPRDDPANWLFSENVESFAISHGWYDPKSGQPFRFYEAYCPPTPLLRRICDARVWSILRRAAPSQHLSPDYHRCKPGSQPYPLSLPPDRKLSVADVMALMRDHYEGTEFDMTKGIDAGPYCAAEPLAAVGLEGRWRRIRLGAADLDAADRVFQHHAIEGVAARPDRRPGLVRHGRQLHHLLCALLLRHRRRAQEFRRRHDSEVLLGFGLVGLQHRHELRLHQILVHHARDSSRAEGHRIDDTSPASTGRKDGGSSYRRPART